MLEPWDEDLARMAIDLASDSAGGEGGPFGAVIARSELVVATGANEVVSSGDPTSHAEIVAIRRACREVGSHVLEGLTIYSSCEPCPMCFGAIWWARMSRLVYVGTRADARRGGFDDDRIFEDVVRPPQKRELPTARVLASEAARPFETWARNASRVQY